VIAKIAKAKAQKTLLKGDGRYVLTGIPNLYDKLSTHIHKIENPPIEIKENDSSPRPHDIEINENDSSPTPHENRVVEYTCISEDVLPPIILQIIPATVSNKKSKKKTKTKLSTALNNSWVKYFTPVLAALCSFISDELFEKRADINDFLGNFAVSLVATNTFEYFKVLMDTKNMESGVVISSSDGVERSSAFVDISKVVSKRKDTHDSQSLLNVEALPPKYQKNFRLIDDIIISPEVSDSISHKSNQKYCNADYTYMTLASMIITNTYFRSIRKEVMSDMLKAHEKTKRLIVKNTCIRDTKTTKDEIKEMSIFFVDISPDLKRNSVALKCLSKPDVAALKFYNRLSDKEKYPPRYQILKIMFHLSNSFLIYIQYALSVCKDINVIPSNISSVSQIPPLKTENNIKLFNSNDEQTNTVQLIDVVNGLYNPHIMMVLMKLVNDECNLAPYVTYGENNDEEKCTVDDIVKNIKASVVRMANIHKVKVGADKSEKVFKWIHSKESIILIANLYICLATTLTLGDTLFDQGEGEGSDDEDDEGDGVKDEMIDDE
jgi:hypothetical protein